jgi:hypothetical protein
VAARKTRAPETQEACLRDSLTAILDGVAAGQFPVTYGGVTILPQPSVPVNG